MEKENSNLKFTYLFRHVDGDEHVFDINIDPNTLSLILPKNFVPPTWAKESKFCCSICPKIDPNHKKCSTCYNMSHVVEKFKNYKSYEDINIIVKSKERRYVYKGDVQRGLMAILGLYMSTSNCPVFKFLKPLARFHLPFASMEETVFRATSVFLLYEYFKMKKGKEPDWNFENLTKIYEQISLANEEIINEVRSHYSNDAHLNAILILDGFSKVLSTMLTEQLDEIEQVFKTSGQI